MAVAEIWGSPAAAAAAMADSENNCPVSKVFSELATKLGLFDIEFAEFVSDLGRNCGTLEEFSDRLKQLGADLPNHAVYSLFTKIYEDVGASRSDIESAIRMSIEDYAIRKRRQNLPIYSVKDDLIKAINDNRVLVVSGGVGCGKTTQIPQYLVESGYASNGRIIGCTGPHTEFVESAAIRVAEEYGCELGQEVGYASTFEDNTSKSTLIKYMAVDLLLEEFMKDSKLSKYSVLVIDEADARTAFTDLLIAILKHFVLGTNHDLRLVVVTSAIGCYPQKLAAFFFDSHVFTIPTTTYPVDIVYVDKPPLRPSIPGLEAIGKIIVEESPGDILVFSCYDVEFVELVCLTHRLVDMHKAHITRDLVILTVDRLLDPSIFEPAPPGKRKLLIASIRFSEVCLSIDGIRYVIDPGLASLGVFDPTQGVYLSGPRPISQESAMQRAALAGRMDKGKCFRAYTQEFYRDQMPPTYPEIQRINLCSIMLFMRTVGKHDLLSSNFIDPPPSQALACATKRLHALGALDETDRLTQLGWTMARFPLDPTLSKMLMASVDLECSDEILSIISMIQTEATYYPPTEHEHLAKRSKFTRPEGDLLTMLAIFEDGKAHNFSEQWCQESFICPTFIRRAHVTKNKLARILQEECMLEVVSAEGNSAKIRQAIASGLHFNAAKKDGKGKWVLADERHTSNSSTKHIHRGDYYMAERVVALYVSERAMKDMTVVEPQWLQGTSNIGSKQLHKVFSSRRYGDNQGLQEF